MRKTIIIAIAVLLLLSILSGVVYAQSISHEPMKGQKLLGVGPLGINDLGGATRQDICTFYFTNPNCEDEITIERIALIREDGKVIYEGPFIWLRRDPDTGEVIEEIPIIAPMKPHQMRYVVLWRFMKDPDATNPDRWLTEQEAQNLPGHGYTLEVMWSGSKQDQPLIGWVERHVTFILTDGSIEISQISEQMINMK